MKKFYWNERVTYQDILTAAGIISWLIIGTWGILANWQFNGPVPTPAIILPVNMIALTFVHWYLSQKNSETSWQERQLLIFCALLIISASAMWVYQI